MIREASEQDIPRIVEMGSRSIREGPYRNQLSDNPEVTKQLAAKLLTSENAKVLVLENDGHVDGVFAFILFSHYFSGEMTAGEMIWYVEPEGRAMEGFGAGGALNLLDEGERLAKKLGAKRMQLTAPTRMVGELYKRRRYCEIETTYQREL